MPLTVAPLAMMVPLTMLPLAVAGPLLRKPPAIELAITTAEPPSGLMTLVLGKAVPTTVIEPPFTKAPVLPSVVPPTTAVEALAQV